MAKITVRTECHIKSEESNVENKVKYVKECISGGFDSSQQQRINHHTTHVRYMRNFKRRDSQITRL